MPDMHQALTPQSSYTPVQTDVARHPLQATFPTMFGNPAVPDMIPLANASQALGTYAQMQQMPFAQQTQQPQWNNANPSPISPPGAATFATDQNTGYMAVLQPGHCRPNPIFLSGILSIINIPSALREIEIADCIRECIPFEIKLSSPVASNERHKPNAYYDWMNREGRIKFTNSWNMEKALAILPYHPTILFHNVIVTPVLPSEVAPYTGNPARIRYIQPRRLVAPLDASLAPEQALRALLPTPGEVFEAARPWGSIRQIKVWRDFAVSQAFGEGSNWRALIEFWYEDEAATFATGFGETGSYMKGWQILVQAEPATDLLPLASAATGYVPNFFPGATANPLQLQNVRQFPQTTEQLSPVTYQASMGIMSIQTSPTRGAFPNLPGVGEMPLTPPYSDTTPWSAHNIFAGKTDYDTGLVLSPSTQGSRRGSLISNKASMTSLRSYGRSSGGRSRQWTLEFAKTPDGDVKAVGLSANDGIVIHHGPGQHIRPAPLIGPGSTSISGLVDYSNVFVKNLDPDINSDFLHALFSPMGEIISAKVMRDESGKSRGYGFVSFQQPEMAARAINALHGTNLGNQQIQVTHHEPRKVRPEKIAERRMLGLPPSSGRSGTQRGRSSTSPTRTENEPWSARTRSGSSEVATSEDIRSLSPDRRKVELERRVSERVKFFIKFNNIPSQLVDPAVEALVRTDLELVPLLENPGALLGRIAETVATLQSDPDMQVGHIANSFPAPSPLSIPEQDRLHAEVERIDPMEVDQIMDILLASVDVHELRHCLNSKSYLAATYNVAKKELIRRQEMSTSERDLGSSLSSQVPEVSKDGAAPSLESDLSSSVPIAPIAPLDMSTIDIETLAAMPARTIMAHLTADSSDVLLMKINMSRPTASSVLELVKWSESVMKKEPAARKSDLATRLARCLGLKYKRSQKIKLAAAIVNEEPDDEAMCKLLAYPDIIDVKAKLRLEQL